MGNNKSSRTPTKKKKKKTTVKFSKNETVEILLKSANTLAVDKKQANVKPGGKITFKIRAKQNLTSFVVLLKGETPFGNGKTWAGGHNGRSVTIRIDGMANGKEETDTSTYAYAVMATDGTKTYHLDPDIVVGPRKI